MNSDLKRKLQAILELETYANNMGFSKATLLLARDILLDERVRMHCQLNLCTNYGKNLMCPPYLPSVADNRHLIDQYTFALLLQLQQELDRNEKEYMRQTFDVTARRFGQMAVNLERKAFTDGFHLAMALGAGECKLCDNCVIQKGEQDCINPGTARPSMEGMGIDVVRTFAAAGLDLAFTSNQLTVAGILLID
ncbi:MAG TPA: DUF2284 domain-containing protein [Syntrophomonadaceae bacterium]|jgi:predicted metal-binding protein|nr:DUF2284 domain-containing protein [Syntrophomonadaceae bacterium]